MIRTFDRIRHVEMSETLRFALVALIVAGGYTLVNLLYFAYYTIISSRH